MHKVNNMKNQYKHFLIFFGLSLALFFVTTAFNTFRSIYLSSWIDSIAFALFTWLSLKKCKERGTQMPLVLIAILLGSIILEIPERIIHYESTYHSLLIPLVKIVSIILAAICFHKRNLAIIIISIAILALLNTVGQMEWIAFCNK